MAVGCGEEPVAVMEESVSLVDHTMWLETSADADPFAAFRPDTVKCPGGSVEYELLAEEPSLSVNTGQCNYVSRMQSQMVDVQAGDTLEIRMWHFPLQASEAAEGVMQLQTDGWSWTRTVPIGRTGTPTKSAIYTDTVTVDKAVPAGSPMYFHLRNHGDNTWNLLSVRNIP